MCLYPRLMWNPKYKRNKKNGGVIPAIPDKRVMYVPIGCGVCIECRKQKSREWQARLMEDIKEHDKGKFITLTFSTVALNKIYDEHEKLKELKGYDLDNGIVIRAVRLFLERWRKKYKKSLRHWLVTELGHGTTEHIHLHGIVWCDDVNEVERIWQYGYVWKGNLINGKLENYVTAKTVNYIVKYINKVDEIHLNYKPMILTSSGIGRSYATSERIFVNKYRGKDTDEGYRIETGHKLNLPIYWRNKVYSEGEREKLWIMKLDKGERYICGEKIKVKNEEDYELYDRVLKYHRERTEALGYPTPEFTWSRKDYENKRRELIHKDRLVNYKSGEEEEE